MNDIQVCFPNDDFINVNMESFAKNIKHLKVSSEFTDVTFAWADDTYIKFKTDDFHKLKRHVRLKNILKE